jgi:hypothetical protein
MLEQAERDPLRHSFFAHSRHAPAWVQIGYFCFLGAFFIYFTVDRWVQSAPEWIPGW